MTDRVLFKNIRDYFCDHNSGRFYMTANQTKEISKFCVAGINYKKTDASVRGQFAIGPEQYKAILSLAPIYGLDELFILSTCNRTEIYGVCENEDDLIRLLCAHTTGGEDVFRELCYVKHGFNALEHIFEVGAGLDSQILGDYEIIGQLKQAVKFSRENHFIASLLERIVNTVLQASKIIKNQTQLSGGTVSVSFSAVQFIKEQVVDIKNKKILLIGTGKIGRTTCKNIIDYLGTSNITLVNRTESTAISLAKELGLNYVNIENLTSHIAETSVILVATNATSPILLKSHLENTGEKLVIDLSIPANVEASVRELPGVTLVDVDELSTLKDKTLKKREAEVPKAKKIIKEHIEEFMEWYHLRKQVPVLNAVKLKLKNLHTCRLFSAYSSTPSVNHDEKVQQVINVMAVKMKHQTLHGCQYIEAINDFITTGKHQA